MGIALSNSSLVLRARRNDQLIRILKTVNQRVVRQMILPAHPTD